MFILRKHVYVDYLSAIIFNIPITENIKGVKIFYVNNKMFHNKSFKQSVYAYFIFLLILILF